MIATIFSSGRLDAPLGFAVAAAVGLAAGFCLERAGLGDSKRVSGMLRLTDMTLLKVLFSAFAVAMLGVTAAIHLGFVSLSALALSDALPLALPAVGGALLGIGLALGGWTPATAVTGMASGRPDALVFLVGALLGCIGFAYVGPWVTPAATHGPMFFAEVLPASLNINQSHVMVGLAIVAVAAFWICEIVERGPLLARPGVSRLFLAVFSAILCLVALAIQAAPVAITPLGGPAALPAKLDAAPGATAAQHFSGDSADKHIISPEDLATRLMAHEPLILVDLRPKEQFDVFHLPGAVNISASSLPEFLNSKHGQPIVLYADDQTLPAKALAALASQGFSDVSVLSGDLTGFFELALKPESLRDEPFDPAKAAHIQAARQFFLPPDWITPHTPGLLTPPGAMPGLAHAAWLAANLGKPGLKVLDLRPASQYDAGHIPGSLSLDPQSLTGTVNALGGRLLPPDMLAGHFGLLGVTPRDLVVLVPGPALEDATFTAMALERLGHSRYVILDGGMAAWKASNLPTDQLLPKVNAVRYPAAAPAAGPIAPASAPAGNFTGGDGFTSGDGFAIGGLDVLAAVAGGQGGQATIIDVRPADVYAATSPNAGRPGHIPGAINRPANQDLATEPNSSSLLPKADLEKAYAALVPSKDQKIIVYGASGKDASQTWWILARLLGYTHATYYDGGWTEWSAHPEWPAAASAPAKEKKQ